MTSIRFVLRGEHIALDALLKATGLVASGGEAKQVIVDAQVRVGGHVDTRRSAKMRSGHLCALGDDHVLLCPPMDPAP